MPVRSIVRIDEEKCDGCGACVPSCVEGALQIVDGKARLVKDIYCDGLGACLGECPRGAITTEKREADPFDVKKAMAHVAETKQAQTQPASAGARSTAPAGCPGSMVRQLKRLSSRSDGGDAPAAESELTNWPVQLKLAPPAAPAFQDADLLLVADCVPFAYADFHKKLLRGKPLIIGCPKLDDADSYVEKLAQILTESNARSLTVAHMEVPCCTGLVRIAEAAMRRAGKDIPFDDVTVSIDGRII